eukprot:m.151861 g.151861  ORF g.151861 m.151861 type:complete len:636 (+) comp15046_c0_seq3:123-2030(+)
MLFAVLSVIVHFPHADLSYDSWRYLWKDNVSDPYQSNSLGAKVSPDGNHFAHLNFDKNIVTVRKVNDGSLCWKLQVNATEVHQFMYVDFTADGKVYVVMEAIKTQTNFVTRTLSVQAYDASFGIAVWNLVLKVTSEPNSYFQRVVGSDDGLSLCFTFNQANDYYISCIDLIAKVKLKEALVYEFPVSLCFGAKDLYFVNGVYYVQYPSGVCPLNGCNVFMMTASGQNMSTRSWNLPGCTRDGYSPMLASRGGEMVLVVFSNDGSYSLSLVSVNKNWTQHVLYDSTAVQFQANGGDVMFLYGISNYFMVFSIDLSTGDKTVYKKSGDFSRAGVGPDPSAMIPSIETYQSAPENNGVVFYVYKDNNLYALDMSNRASLLWSMPTGDFYYQDEIDDICGYARNGAILVCPTFALWTNTTQGVALNDHMTSTQLFLCPTKLIITVTGNCRSNLTGVNGTYYRNPLEKGVAQFVNEEGFVLQTTGSNNIITFSDSKNVILYAQGYNPQTTWICNSTDNDDETVRVSGMTLGGCFPCADDCMYGLNCSKPCTCNCGHGTCDISTGHCLSCFGNYSGVDCENCNTWHFGENCSSECLCDRYKTQTCDTVTGTCHCRPNAMGPKCSQCKPGSYGETCENCSSW